MTTEELVKIVADKEVDARGVACPGPLLEAKRGITTVPVGGVIVILSSDSSTNNDLPRWAAKMGHEHLGTIVEPGYWRILIKRAK
jgi:TusA-related sulfurtransferase